MHGVAEIPPRNTSRASTVKFPKQPHQFRFAAAGFPNQLRQFVVQDINDVVTASPGQVGWGKQRRGGEEEERRGEEEKKRRRGEEEKRRRGEEEKRRRRGEEEKKRRRGEEEKRRREEEK